MRRLRPALPAILGLTALGLVLGVSAPGRAQTPSPGPGPDAAPARAPAAEAPRTASEPADDASDQAAAPPPKPAPPAKRPQRSAAVLQALDKVTTETLRFEAAINQPVRYKDLVFVVRACEENASDEAQPGAFAYVEIDSQPKAAAGKPPPPARQLFKGWMLANAPAAHPFEHPVYDAWLIACKTASPGS